MKIPGSIRELYESKRDQYVFLKEHVDKKLTALKDPKWHFESRVKELQSFALKLETGRCEDPKNMEDFFACTLVVENQNVIEPAIEFVKNKCGFIIKYQRPKTDKLTFKRPEWFPFDDLRLYVEWQDDPRVKPTNLDKMLFEFQIKTYLQHAWAIATHDLVYKADQIVSWSKKRISFQVKAMLEHAEVAISEAEGLSNNLQMKKTDYETIRINKLTRILKNSWNEGQLPTKINVLANTTFALLECLDIGIQRFKKILADETDAGKGTNILNLSPYGIIVESIFKNEPEKVKKYLERDDGRINILITREMDLPEYMKNIKSKKLIHI